LLDADESFGGSCAGAWKIIYPIDLATSDRTCSRNLYGQIEKISAKFFDEMSAQNKRLTTFLSLL
jgi:hypothetical protein